MTFDPFTATLAEAQAQPDADEVRGAVLRCCGAHQLLERRDFYERKPIDGMAVCALYDLIAPDWLARAYLRCFYRVANCEVRSWDEAFGAPFPPGKNLAAMRRARHHRPAAFLAFTDILKRDPARRVDKALWKEIGDCIGEGATRAEELYREALAMGIGVKPARFRKPVGKRRAW